MAGDEIMPREPNLRKKCIYCHKLIGDAEYETHEGSYTTFFHPACRKARETDPFYQRISENALRGLQQ
jgi:hypothetical protein